MVSPSLQGQEQNEVARGVVQYYFRLRILANTSAKAGNYERESKVEQDSKVTFAPLDVNFDYAGFAFRSTIMQPGTAWVLRHWLEERDLHTRGLMCNYMKGGMTHGEALLKALGDSQIKWGTAPTPTPGEARRRLRSRSPARFTGENKGGKKRKVQQTLGKTQQNFQSHKGGKGEREGRHARQPGQGRQDDLPRFQPRPVQGPLPLQRRPRVQHRRVRREAPVDPPQLRLLGTAPPGTDQGDRGDQ